MKCLITALGLLVALALVPATATAQCEGELQIQAGVADEFSGEWEAPKPGQAHKHLDFGIVIYTGPKAGRRPKTFRLWNFDLHEPQSPQ